MNKIFRISVTGFFTWLIPFIVSVFLFGKDGKPSIDIITVKTILMLVGGLSGSLLLIYYMVRIREHFLKESLILGSVWLIINWVFDIIILIPMSKMTYQIYFSEIGLRYLLILIMCVSSGYLMEKARGN